MEWYEILSIVILVVMIGGFGNNGRGLMER